MAEESAQEAAQRASRIVDDARERQAQQVVATLHDLGGSRLLGTCVGDVSVRIAGTDRFLATWEVPFLQKLNVDQLLEATMDGEILHKRKHATFSLQMHAAVYVQRPDVQAIVHSHAPFATVLGVCDLPIPPVTFDSLPFLDVPRVAPSAPSEVRWPQEAAQALADGAVAALLVHHGIVTVGTHLWQAVRRTLVLEETARILVIAHLLRQVPSTLAPEAVEILGQALL